MKQLLMILTFLTTCSTIWAKEYHAAKNGNDNNPGTAEVPLLSIQAAADRAQHGDTITVHQGIYREEIVPPGSGISAEKPIVYRAANGENVFQKGSNPQTMSFNVGEKLFEKTYPLITSEYIGILPVPKMAMENPDGTPLDIATDYSGNSIDPDHVMPSPFQQIKNEATVFEIWPKKKGKIQ
jgi:hypothetical protein